MRNRTTAHDRRIRRQNAQGLALIAFVLCGFIALGYTCYAVDKARGITVEQSLRSAGF